MRRLLRAICHPQRMFVRILEKAEGLLPRERVSKIAKDAGQFWSESGSKAIIRDYSHWRGEGRWADEQTWAKIGDTHFKVFGDLCLLAGISRPIHSMVEWGPGGGANAVRFCSEVSSYYGIDISTANLDECRRQLHIQSFDGFHPVLIHADHPEEVLQSVRTPVDLFLSTAVFQHFPGKEYGVLVMKVAYDLVSSGGGQ